MRWYLPEVWGASRRLNSHPERKLYALFPSFRICIFLFEVLVLGVGSTTWSSIKPWEDICEDNTRCAEKETGEIKKGTYPSKLWNFLSPSFWTLELPTSILFVMVDCYLWFAQKSRSWGKGLICTSLDDTISGNMCAEQREWSQEGGRVSMRMHYQAGCHWAWWSSKKPCKLHLMTVHQNGRVDSFSTNSHLLSIKDFPVVC